nr:LEF-1 [Calliteara abietis nucleopolyhedrovirus]
MNHFEHKQHQQQQQQQHQPQQHKRQRRDIYTKEQVLLMWNSIAYNNCREYAFFDGVCWHHPKRTFETFQLFYSYIIDCAVSDVHVKALPDNKGREWVVDVDFKESDERVLELKIDIAAKTFCAFFGESVARVMHTGNRGIHVWLKIDRFRINVDKQCRNKYYKAFVKPKVIVLNKIARGSFVYCLKTTLESATIKVAIGQLTPGIKLSIEKQLHYYWPEVDQHVFCNLTQIRAPYSFHYKGDKFSKCLY